MTFNILASRLLNHLNISRLLTPSYHPEHDPLPLTVLGRNFSETIPLHDLKKSSVWPTERNEAETRKMKRWTRRRSRRFTWNLSTTTFFMTNPSMSKDVTLVCCSTANTFQVSKERCTKDPCLQGWTVQRLPTDLGDLCFVILPTSGSASESSSASALDTRRAW